MFLLKTFSHRPFKKRLGLYLGLLNMLMNLMANWNRTDCTAIKSYGKIYRDRSFTPFVFS